MEYNTRILSQHSTEIVETYYESNEPTVIKLLYDSIHKNCWPFGVKEAHVMFVKSKSNFVYDLWAEIVIFRYENGIVVTVNGER